MSADTSFTPHEIAVSAFEAATRQLEDARSRLPALQEAHTAAVAERARTQAAVAALSADERQASEASTTHRTDNRIDHLVRVRVLLEHAVGDDVAAVEAGRTAKDALTQCEAEIVSSNDSVSRALACVALNSGAFEVETRADVDAIVAAVFSMIARYQAIELRTAEDNLSALVAGMPARDGSCAAGFLAEALMRAGGAFGGNEHQLRWPFDPHEAHETLADPLDAVSDIFANVISSFRAGRAQPDAANHILRRVSSWASARNKVEAAECEKRVGTAEGQARQAELDRFYAERRAKHDQAAAAAKGRPYSTSANGALTFLGEVATAVKRALSPQEVAERRFAPDRRPGEGGRPAANRADGEYDPTLDPSSAQFGQTAEPASSPTVPSARVPGVHVHQLSPPPRVTIEGPTTFRAPHHETPNATIVGRGSSGTAPQAPTAVRPGYIKSSFDGKVLPTREALGDGDGEFIISDGMPSTEGPRLPDGSIERVAATSTRRPKGWRQ
jgi:hypothetical protein